jgi:hypothetical protein
MGNKILTAAPAAPAPTNRLNSCRLFISGICASGGRQVAQFANGLGISFLVVPLKPRMKSCGAAPLPLVHRSSFEKHMFHAGRAFAATDLQKQLESLRQEVRTKADKS